MAKKSKKKEDDAEDTPTPTKKVYAQRPDEDAGQFAERVAAGGEGDISMAGDGMVVAQYEFENYVGFAQELRAQATEVSARPDLTDEVRLPLRILAGGSMALVSVLERKQDQDRRMAEDLVGMARALTGDAHECALYDEDDYDEEDQMTVGDWGMEMFKGFGGDRNRTLGIVEAAMNLALNVGCTPVELGRVLKAVIEKNKTLSRTVPVQEETADLEIQIWAFAHTRKFSVHEMVEDKMMINRMKPREHFLGILKSKVERGIPIDSAPDPEPDEEDDTSETPKIQPTTEPEPEL